MSPAPRPPAPAAPELAPAEIARLAREARAGDRAAWEELANLFWPEIHRMIALRLRRPGEAEDLAQEVFLKAQAGLPHLAQPASFRPWLFSIALNQVRDFRRRERLWGLVGLGPAWEADPAEEAVAAPGENAFDEVWQGEFHRRLHEFSQRLSRREREVFLLRFVDELTLPETAQALDLHVSAVKTHLYRALAKFKADRQFRAFLRELEP